ncbi:MAG: hypothetical protein R3C59_06210 [Planctomycetaceae bacterium]
MPTTEEDLLSFQQYASARIRSGGEALELAELVEEWREQNLSRNAQAIQKALNHVGSSQGRLLNEFVADFERRHDISS